MATGQTPKYRAPGEFVKWPGDANGRMTKSIVRDSENNRGSGLRMLIESVSSSFDICVPLYRSIQPVSAEGDCRSVDLHLQRGKSARISHENMNTNTIQLEASDVAHRRWAAVAFRGLVVLLLMPWAVGAVRVLWQGMVLLLVAEPTCATEMHIVDGIRAVGRGPYAVSRGRGPALDVSSVPNRWTYLPAGLIGRWLGLDFDGLLVAGRVVPFVSAIGIVLLLAPLCAARDWLLAAGGSLWRHDSVLSQRDTNGLFPQSARDAGSAIHFGWLDRRAVAPSGVALSGRGTVCPSDRIQADVHRRATGLHAASGVAARCDEPETLAGDLRRSGAGDGGGQLPLPRRGLLPAHSIRDGSLPHRSARRFAILFTPS